jgi:hypothetical protein
MYGTVSRWLSSVIAKCCSRARRARSSRAEAAGHQGHGREHLGREVGRRLSVARLAKQEADHRRQMAAIEGRERLSVAGHHRGQQVAVRPLRLS